jgi:hypothetical protein
MPSRFSSGLYGQDVFKLMVDALDAALAKFDPPPKNVDLGRQLLASAIIEAVEDDARERDVLTERAVRALDEAIHRDPVALYGNRPTGVRET